MEETNVQKTRRHLCRLNYGIDVWFYVMSALGLLFAIIYMAIAFRVYLFIHAGISILFLLFMGLGIPAVYIKNRPTLIIWLVLFSFVLAVCIIGSAFVDFLLLDNPDFVEVNTPIAVLQRQYRSVLYAFNALYLASGIISWSIGIRIAVIWRRQEKSSCSHHVPDAHVTHVGP